MRPVRPQGWVGQYEIIFRRKLIPLFYFAVERKKKQTNKNCKRLCEISLHYTQVTLKLPVNALKPSGYCTYHLFEHFYNSAVRPRVLFVYVSYDVHNKQRSLHTKFGLTSWSLQWTQYEVRTEFLSTVYTKFLFRKLKNIHRDKQG